MLYDVAIIGAGPIGLACAIEIKRLNLSHVVIDKGYLVNSIYNFPQNMTFFSTADLMEIGDIPFIISGDKARRMDALRYYWRVSEHYQLNLKLFTRVIHINKNNNEFTLKTDRGELSAGSIILATGYYDNPNKLNIPGEDLPQVSHYYSDPHCYIHKKVVVIGANNSAVEASLELHRYGVDVTLVHRGHVLGKGIKYWILPDIRNRIRNGDIPALFKTCPEEITETSVKFNRDGEKREISADAVLALTGYHPDFDFMRKIGIHIDKDTSIPVFDEATGETNVSRIYIAGSLQAGRDANKIFIENGRLHAPVIAKSIKESLG